MLLYEIKEQTPIYKGWSSDQKYCATAESGTKYLLRIAPQEQYDRKKSEFELALRVAALGVPMCLPVEFGICDGGVYSLESWIHGTDAECAIPSMPDADQYAYGLEAGRILKQIHSIPAPASQEDWATLFNRKIDRKIQKYNECTVKHAGGQIFLDYISANRHLLSCRPQTVQHGDYHRGNLMVDHCGVLHVIDFGRGGFGDPWEDMAGITWDIQMSPLFASGRVDGYFDHAVPMDFWRLLALYICVGTLSSIPWAVPFGEKEVETMLGLATEVLGWYDNLRSPIPNWYQSPPQSV